MDKAESGEILAKKVAELRRRSYDELRHLMASNDSEPEERTGPSGTTYNLDTQVFFDGGPEDNLRVIVAIDDGGWRAFSPRSMSFIMSPDGGFVGE